MANPTAPQAGSDALPGMVERWLTATLEGRLSRDPSWAELEKALAQTPLGAHAQRFGLDGAEVKVLCAAWGSANAGPPLALGVLGRGLGLTPAALGRLLVPSARLLRHGLVRVTRAGGAFLVELADGMALRLAGDATLWAPATDVVPSPTENPAEAARYLERFAMGPRLQDTLRHFIGNETRLAAVQGATVRDAFSLATAIGRKLNRRAYVVDGWALAALPERREVLVGLRRDCEQDGAVLVVSGALELRDCFFVVTQPLAAAPDRPLCVVLCDERELPGLAMPPGEQYLRLIELRLGKAESSAVNVTIAPAATPVDPNRPDPFASYRQQAALDAQKAMGVTTEDVRQAASLAMRMPSATRTVMPTPPPAPPAPAPEPVPIPVVAAPPPVATTPVPSPTPVAAPTLPLVQPEVEASAKKGKKGKKPKKGDGAPEAKPEEAPAATAAPDGAAEAAPVPPPAEPPPSGPPLEIPKNATPRILAQIILTSPNAEQRIDLISQLAEVRDPAVIAAIRANVKSEHPGVRAAAEVVMAKLFGPNWATTRAIPKPVQPPRSDDNDRGPPGGW